MPLARNVVSCPAGRRRAQLDRDGLAGGVLHLGRDRPLEDQVVERELVPAHLPRDLGGRAEHVAGRADRLVSLLRVCDRALVPARLGGHRLRPVLARRVRARRLQRRVGQRHRVGAHVGDVPVLVQALGEAHGRLGREAQLAARLLLECRRPERRGRAARVRLLVDLADRERPAAEAVGELSGARLVEHEDLGAGRAVLAEVATLRDAPSIHGDQPGLERPGLEGAEHVPVVGGDEPHPLALALDHEPGGDGLHPAGRQARHHLLPEHR